MHDYLNCSFSSYQTSGTPLYVASRKGHHEVVLSLLGAGADVNIARSDVSNVMINYVMTPWHYELC